MATGVLVVAVGEGTKLLRWLTAEDKVYRATIALGEETDTLDAEGQVVARAPIPAELDRERIRSTAAPFVGTYRQVAPAFSAIKVDGEALHERARRGETVVAPERDVTVRRLEVRGLERTEEQARVEIEVEAAKGFYVRALARDLARALGTRGHLVALRRLRSGSFGLEDAVSGELLGRAASGVESARSELRARVLPLADACAAMPRIVLDDPGVEDARHGRPVRLDAGAGVGLVEGTEPVAMFSRTGELVALGRVECGRLRVVRGVRT